MKPKSPQQKTIPVVTPEMDAGPWTQFWDMHSGGGLKEPWARIYIQAPEAEARVIFYNRFGHSPDRVSCTCCGEDYSVDQAESLSRATAYHRNCKWSKEANGYVEQADADYESYLTLAAYMASDDVLVIPASEIKPDERKGDVPRQGYVWQD
jgi:hypothetical protein